MGLTEYLFDRVAPPQPAYWHKWSTGLLPVRCIDGTLAQRVWRRKTANGWEYQPRDFTDEEIIEKW